MGSVQLYRKKLGLDLVPADGDKAKAEAKTKATERAISEILSDAVARTIVDRRRKPAGEGPKPKPKPGRRVSTGRDEGARG
jgi:hypothetical protein